MFFVGPGPESIADIALALCHGNGRGELDPNRGRNAIATDPARAAAAAAAATSAAGTARETGAESDPGGGTEASVRGTELPLWFRGGILVVCNLHLVTCTHLCVSV